jgi:hypothetical protein
MLRGFTSAFIHAGPPSGDLSSNDPSPAVVEAKRRLVMILAGNPCIQPLPAAYFESSQPAAPTTSTALKKAGGHPCKI